MSRNCKKMILAYIFEVLVIVCALDWRSSALEAGGAITSAPCNFTIQEDNNVIFNCSKRNVRTVTSWPDEIDGLDKGALVAIFNETVTTVPGARVAITFSFNKIAGIEDDAFKNVETLVYLDLSNNQITGAGLRSEIFRGAYTDGVYSSLDLETLNLGYNQIHSLDRYLFQYTPNLTRLYLNDNPIEILDHVTVLALSSNTNLEVLDLANTQIDSIPLDAFRGLVALREINLSGNKFVTVPESLILLGTTLEYLIFNNNTIMELNDDSFNGLVNLKKIELGENAYLEEVKRSTFSPLTSLRVLHLCHNPNLRYISHNAFRGLSDKWTLKEVYLDENNLSELSTDLMVWNKLEVLGMAGNNWLCNCDLANIVTKQGAGSKFRKGEIPYCASPIKMIGAYVTNITLTYCPTLDDTFNSKKGFSFSDLKPRHILWSVLGVTLVACLGMLIGLLVNAIKAFYNRKIKNEPVRYVNLNNDSSYA